MPTRKNRKAERLDDVLQVAARLFNERGYSACSLADIGAELGMHKASLYYYVSSKEDLLVKVVTGASSKLRAVMDEVALTGGPVERLETVVRNHGRVVLTHRDVFGILIEQRRQLDEAALAPLLPGERRYVDGVRALLKELESDGLIPADDERLRLRMTMDMLNGIERWHPADGSTKRSIDYLWIRVSRSLGLDLDQ
jgi:AcrR family transcriptional regulator